MAANVNVLARDALLPVSAEIVPGDSEVRILWPDRVIGHFLVANQLEQALGHLLPVSLSEGLQVSVPSAYLTLASLQIALGLAGGRTIASAQEWLRLPPAYLTLHYADVHGEAHMKRLQFLLKLLSAGHESVAHTSGQLPTFMQFMANLDEA